MSAASLARTARVQGIPAPGADGRWRLIVVEGGGEVGHMPLQPEHQRQIGQFMFIAEYYLRLAQPAERETTETLGMTKDDFLPGVPLTENTRRLTPIGRTYPPLRFALPPSRRY